MPELPEVEATRLSLLDLVGMRITTVQTFRPDLRYPLPPKLDTCLRANRLQEIARKGKVLFWKFGAVWMISHLGMSGSFRKRVLGTPVRKHDHIVWHLSDVKTARKTELAYNDPRRFGYIHLAHSWEEAKTYLPLGNDPFDPDLTADILLQKLHNRRIAVKVLLLDQTFIAGIGNIYASEILWHAGICPFRMVKDLNRAMVDSIICTTQKILTTAIKANGTTLKNHHNADGVTGMYHNLFVAYDQDGKSCSYPGCGGVIRKLSQQQRQTYFCSEHQR